ncbi:SAM-dependent methyltransferase [Bailinhaonella thermotolerans]|uniref:SAM-dependent methyltransferase n=1 Tax=Bailinhaonella thermotolerans TaxID=1070861 RepID=A0A3A4BW79_9ACTN|nr:SAM-dependent methyltransferase [Bailinhaonella thermotolerans]RJL35848.1 SAM-dependent methyltransferase [Bailinhaonella thermotolerans]
MAAEEFPPVAGIDISKPNVARVYDAFLGGKDNYAADRAVVEESLRWNPDAAKGAQANRAFLRRAVRTLAGSGVGQFLDIGSGLPTAGNVHEVAQAVDPDARVVYVDHDPVVLTHGRALLENSKTTAFVQADVRDPDAILGHEKVREFIDFERPVGLLLFAILHHVPDADRPADIAARLREPLPPGSFLAVSHFFDPGPAMPEISEVCRGAERYFDSTLGSGRWRTREEILEYFGDFELLDPGLTLLNEWRPTGDEPGLPPVLHNTFAAGVARKP